MLAAPHEILYGIAAENARKTLLLAHVLPHAAILVLLAAAARAGIVAADLRFFAARRLEGNDFTAFGIQLTRDDFRRGVTFELRSD